MQLNFNKPLSEISRILWKFFSLIEKTHRKKKCKKRQIPKKGIKNFLSIANSNK